MGSNPFLPPRFFMPYARDAEMAEDAWQATANSAFRIRKAARSLSQLGTDRSPKNWRKMS